MSKPDHPENTADNWFNRHGPTPFKVNRRMGIRYIRNDLGITLRKIGLFKFNIRGNEDIPVKLVDISSRGVLIATNIKLPINKKVFLTIRFADFKEYKIPSEIVRKSEGAEIFYGIKFDRLNDDLAEKLLATQRKLAFR